MKIVSHFDAIVELVYRSARVWGSRVRLGERGCCVSRGGVERVESCGRSAETETGV
jgi:hypothetical protein